MNLKERYSSAELQAGCYVDASAQSADDCNKRTIDFAEDWGFETLYDTEAEDGEGLSEIADAALEHLNDLEQRPNYWWEFEDNSLFLVNDPRV